MKQGGRSRGANKDTLRLVELTKKHKREPFEILLLYANRDYSALGIEEYITKSTPTGETYKIPSISPELSQKAAKDAADFLYPKRKSIDIRNDEEKEPPKFIINLQGETKEA